eukprot:TRINITY_DN4842_c0_g4_i1.p2 TRINITY_DN4842_c0_g4~~TRINITY_DN4842_c0_g4_i1.p2  ORF type:complete len:125 (-),score=5.03 TRINITY_DN4842_c0_g4_i1:1445-1819(-)
MSQPLRGFDGLKNTSSMVAMPPLYRVILANEVTHSTKLLESNQIVREKSNLDWSGLLSSVFLSLLLIHENTYKNSASASKRPYIRTLSLCAVQFSKVFVLCSYQKAHCKGVTSTCAARLYPATT